MNFSNLKEFKQHIKSVVYQNSVSNSESTYSSSSSLSSVNSIYTNSCPFDSINGIYQNYCRFRQASHTHNKHFNLNSSKSKHIRKNKCLMDMIPHFGDLEPNQTKKKKRISSTSSFDEYDSLVSFDKCFKNNLIQLTNQNFQLDSDSSLLMDSFSFDLDKKCRSKITCSTPLGHFKNEIVPKKKQKEKIKREKMKNINMNAKSIKKSKKTRSLESISPTQFDLVLVEKDVNSYKSALNLTTTSSSSTQTPEINSDDSGKPTDTYTKRCEIIRQMAAELKKKGLDLSKNDEVIRKNFKNLRVKIKDLKQEILDTGNENNNNSSQKEEGGKKFENDEILKLKSDKNSINISRNDSINEYIPVNIRIKINTIPSNSFKKQTKKKTSTSHKNTTNPTMPGNESQEISEQSIEDNTSQDLDMDKKKIKFIYGQEEYNKINTYDTLKKNLKTGASTKQYQTNRVKFNDMIEMYDPGMKNRTNVPMSTRSNSVSDSSSSMPPNKNGYYTYKPPNPYRANSPKGNLGQNMRHPMIEFLYAEKASLQLKKSDRKTSLVDEQLNSYRVQKLSEIQNFDKTDQKEFISDRVGTKFLPKNPDDRFYFEYNKFIDKDLDDLAENIVLPLKSTQIKINEPKDLYIHSIPEESSLKQDEPKIKEFYLDEEKKKLAEEQAMYSQLIKISLDPEHGVKKNISSIKNEKDSLDNVTCDSKYNETSNDKANNSISLLISNSTKLLDLDNKYMASKNEDNKPIEVTKLNNEASNSNSNQNSIKITKNPVPIRRVVEVKTNQIKLNSLQITPQIKIQLPVSSNSKDLNLKLSTSENIENKGEKNIEYSANDKNIKEKFEFKLEPRKADLKVAGEIANPKDSAFYITNEEVEKDDDTITDEEMFHRYHSMKSQQSKFRRRSSKIGEENYDRELNDIFKKIYNRHRDSVTAISNDSNSSSNDESTLTNFRRLSKARLNFTSAINE